MEYKSTVRTHIDIPKEELKTERQWAEVGYIKVDENCGTMLWSNQNCRQKYLYLHVSEVKKASAEELEAYFKPFKEQAKKRVKAVSERKQKIKAVGFLLNAFLYEKLDWWWIRHNNPTLKAIRLQLEVFDKKYDTDYESVFLEHLKSEYGLTYNPYTDEFECLNTPPKVCGSD